MSQLYFLNKDLKDAYLFPEAPSHDFIAHLNYIGKELFKV